MDIKEQKTILLVEDEALIAMAEKIILEQYDYKVIIANSGEEAVTVVEKTPAIDLILMDINLGGGIDGTEAADLILKERDIPVIFLSSHTEPEIVAKTEKITSYGYVVKASSNTVLDASIKMAFKLFEAKIKEKEKEKALRESEASYRVLFSGASDGILLADLQKKQFHHANPAICRMLGYTEAELLRLSVADIHPQESLYRVLAVFAALAQGEIVSSPDIPCLRKDGTIFYANISHSSMVMEGHEYQAGFFHDITERKRSTESLARQNDAMSKLNQFSIELSMMSAEDKLEALIAKRIKEIAGAELAVFSEFDTENRTTTIRNIEMEPGLLKKAVDLLGKQVEKIHSTVSAEMYQEMTKEIIGTRKTLYEMSFGAISRPVGAAIQALLNVDRFIGIAYLVEGKLYGTSVLAMNKDQPDPAQPILENFSYLASMSLRRKRAESQRKAALDKLRESEEQYRQLFEGANLGIFQSTPEGKAISVNSAFARMFGYDSPQDAIREIENVATDIFVDPMRRGEIIRLMTEQPDLRAFENLYRRKDGSSFIGNLSTMSIRDSAGCLVRIEGIIEDITERKRIEIVLSESEDRYRDLVENSQDLICTHDLEGKVLTMNKAAARLTGYSIKELLAMNMADLLLPEVRHLFKPYLAEIKAKGWARGTMRVQTAGGESRYWEFHNTLRTKGVPVPVVRGLGRDITEKERADKEIKHQLVEKEILLKEVHHRIKNNIAAISGLLSQRLQSIANPEAIAVLQDAIGRVDSMRLLYDKLLLSEDYKDVSVRNYLDDLIDKIIAIFPDKVTIELEKRIVDFQLDSKRLFPLGIIINELLTNIMKYAFSGRDYGLIKISIKKIKSHVTLIVEDDGNGLPAGFDIDKSKGFGLMLVKMLSQQLGGSFSMERQAGTLCKIEFDV
jgi:PAS domain S-box-containing protein